MTEVYYFSAAGHCKALAELLGEMLRAPVRELPCNPSADTAVVVFPVYCQNIPGPVRQFLKNLKAPQVALAAAYGQMGRGNVLWEGAKLVSGTVVAGAYVPTGHTYLGGSVEPDLEKLRQFTDRIADPTPAKIGRSAKVWYADLTPALRSRLGVSLMKTDRCTECGLCSRRCPMGTMNNGIPGNRCIRCLRCVSECPAGALTAKLSPIMKRYLRKKRSTDFILFL